MAFNLHPEYGYPMFVDVTPTQTLVDDAEVVIREFCSACETGLDHDLGAIYSLGQAWLKRYAEEKTKHES